MCVRESVRGEEKTGDTYTDRRAADAAGERSRTSLKPQRKRG